MLKIANVVCPGLSPAVSSQFSIEMCAASKNCEKFIKKWMWGSPQCRSRDPRLLACVVLTQYRSVTNRRTDRRTPRKWLRRAKHSAIARKNLLRITDKVIDMTWVAACRYGECVTHFIRSTKLLYAGGPGRVSTAMGDCLRAGEPFLYVTSRLRQFSLPSFWGR